MEFCWLFWIACEQALRCDLALDSQAQAVDRVTSAPSLSRLASQSARDPPFAPENLARDHNGELARRLVLHEDNDCSELLDSEDDVFLFAVLSTFMKQSL